MQKKVRDNFLSLAKDVKTFKNTLKNRKNKNLCDETSDLNAKIIRDFEIFVEKKEKDFEKWYKDESVEIKTSIAQILEIKNFRIFLMQKLV